jgi:hypothetical protein
MQDALVGLEDPLSDQIAGSKTPQRTKADAEEPGETERERRGYHPLRVEQRPTITGEDRIPKSADDDTSLRHGDADAAAQELAVDSNPRLLPR